MEGRRSSDFMGKTPRTSPSLMARGFITLLMQGPLLQGLWLLPLFLSILRSVGNFSLLSDCSNFFFFFLITFFFDFSNIKPWNSNRGAPAKNIDQSEGSGGSKNDRRDWKVRRRIKLGRTGGKNLRGESLSFEFEGVQVRTIIDRESEHESDQEVIRKDRPAERQRSVLP